MKSSNLLFPLSLFSVLPAPVLGDAFGDLWSQYMEELETKKYESTVSRRERNLDHWDVPTAAAYLGLHPETLKPLPEFAAESSSTTTGDGASGSSSSPAAPQQPVADEYVGHDAAVLFYAQWCQNCHHVAPSWDAIATHLNAGSRSSNLIMALFDCEKNTRHMELCLAAGIKAYPTMMFVGSGTYRDTDPVTGAVLGKDKSAGPFGATTLRRTVKFQGNWQYPDQILDWVSLMKGLSSWHKVAESGPLRFLRNGLFNFITGGKSPKLKAQGKGREGSIPVGVPPNFQTELRAIGGSPAVTAEELKDLQTKLNATSKEKDIYEKAVTHSGHLLEGLLFPKESNGTGAPPRDPFSVLTASDGWFQTATSLPPGAPNDEHPAVLRPCALELTIDYCNRVTTRATSDYLEVLAAIPQEDTFPTLAEIEAHLLDVVTGAEPYCGSIEKCILGNFEEEECRPALCPFENEVACRYIESCLDTYVQDEYGLALGLIEKEETIADKDFSGVGAGTGGTKEGGTSSGGASASVGGWGIPVS
ncbi:hypothetical protein ACHAWF_015865 [Thalassiosira exigua]